jgi:hypothetical protein
MVILYLVFVPVEIGLTYLALVFLLTGTNARGTTIQLLVYYKEEYSIGVNRQIFMIQDSIGGDSLMGEKTLLSLCPPAPKKQKDAPFIPIHKRL